MKELFKLTNTKIYFFSMFLSILYSLAEYGVSFALAYFGTVPFNLDKATSLLVFLVIFYIVMLISHYIELRIDNVVYSMGEVDISKYYFNKLQNMPSKNISETHTGYIYNLIKDTGRLYEDLLWLIKDTFIPLIIGLCSFFYMACTQSITMGLICIFVCIMAILTKYIMMKNMVKYEKMSRDKHSKFTALLIDFIQNISTVKKLNINTFCNTSLLQKEEEYSKTLKVTEKKRANRNSIFHGHMYLLYILILFSVISVVKSGNDGLSYLLFYFTLLGNMYGKLNSASRLIDNKVQFNAAKKQLDAFFKDNIELKLIKDWNKLELKEVIFKYNTSSSKILIPEFIFKKGDKISIMGESGQGKSTILNILSGMYPLDSGKFIIDGKEIHNEKLDLVFVSQEVDLFDLSIRENLCLGKDIKEEEILKLFDDAGLTEWYKSLPNGLDTIVGERGLKLSAGQKQRLNIIRGILIDKDVYFFDEPTSNLDSISEQKITEMINKYLKDKTYIIVTHRPALKNLCNKHYVFENHMIKEVTTV